MDNDQPLTPVTRARFRAMFQPSRIAIGLFSAANGSGVNALTLCYMMHSSHKPRTMTVAIEDRNYTHGLIPECRSFVLAVPGERMADETVYLGTTSMHTTPDKIAAASLLLAPSQKIATPSLAAALGNIELEVDGTTHVRDHVLVHARVVARTLRSNPEDELPLLSVGPDLRGFRLLRKSGIHRIAVLR